VTVLDPEWSQPDELPAAQQESEAFTRETGILVKHLPVPETSLSQLGLWRKLLKEGGPTPDVLAIDVVWPGILDEYLIDLKPYAAEELSSEDPELVSSYTAGGKVVGLPYHTQIGVLAYRVDLLREYGYQHPPTTWDELEKMAARIQAGERAKGKKDFWGYLWQGAAAEGLTCNALECHVAEGGGRVIENDKTISVNNPAAIRAWQRAAHWIGWITPPGVVAYRELDSMNVWNSGGAASKVTEPNIGTIDLMPRLARLGPGVYIERPRICNRLSLSGDYTSLIASRNASIHILRTHGGRSWLQIQTTECRT
jgi:trehalose/maltose transport system substrate-binding protein